MGFLIAPIMQIVQIGTQITEALAGLERTHEIGISGVKGAHQGKQNEGHLSSFPNHELCRVDLWDKLRGLIPTNIDREFLEHSRRSSA
jgi:hypothetical protein